MSCLIVCLIAVEFLFMCVALFTTQNKIKADLQPMHVSIKQSLWAQMNSESSITSYNIFL